MIKTYKNDTLSNGDGPTILILVIGEILEN